MLLAKGERHLSKGSKVTSGSWCARILLSGLCLKACPLPVVDRLFVVYPCVSKWQGVEAY